MLHWGMKILNNGDDKHSSRDTNYHLVNKR